MIPKHFAYFRSHISTITFSTNIVLHNNHSHPPHLFNAAEWVGVGKKWVGELPSPVIAAHLQAVESIPDIFKNTLPSKECTVDGLLKSLIPKHDIGGFSLASTEVFLQDPPSTNTTLLFKNPLPVRSYVVKLFDASKQAWLDGKKSVKDIRYNGLYLPLWAIGWWKMAWEVVEAKKAWSDALRWIEKGLKDWKGDASTVKELKTAQQKTLEFPWNGHLPHSSTIIFPSTFADLLSDRWVSGDMVDIAMLSLKERLEKAQHGPNGGKYREIDIETLAFTNSLLNTDHSDRKMEKWKRRWSKKGQAIRILLFPAWVNQGHFIAIRVNLRSCTINWSELYQQVHHNDPTVQHSGDSGSKLGLAPPWTFLKKLQRCLARLLPPTGSNRAYSVIHADDFAVTIQLDWFNL